MRRQIDLLIDVGIASLMITIGLFLPVSIILLFSIPVTSFEENIIGIITAFVPGGLAAWWMFRKLQNRCSRREALTVSILFAISTPVLLGISILLAPLPGGFADLWLGPPFGLVGAVVGIFVIATFLSFGLCMLALWIAHRIGGTHPVQSPDGRLS